MAEFILFFLSLSRFMFSILQTKRTRLQLGPDTQSVPLTVERGAGSSGGSRAAKAAGTSSKPPLLSVRKAPILPLSTYLLGGPGLGPAHFFPGTAPHHSVGRSLGRFLVPDSPQYSIFFGWLLGRLAGFGDHVSNFLQAICQVSELIAAAFRGEYQLSQLVDLIFILQEAKQSPSSTE